MAIERYRVVATVTRENERLKRSEARLRLIIEAMPAGVVLVDQAGKIQAMNLAGAALVGTGGPSDVVGRELYSLADHDGIQALRDLVARAFDGARGKVSVHLPRPRRRAAGPANRGALHPEGRAGPGLRARRPDVRDRRRAGRRHAAGRRAKRPASTSPSPTIRTRGADGAGAGARGNAGRRGAPAAGSRERAHPRAAGARGAGAVARDRGRAPLRRRAPARRRLRDADELDAIAELEATRHARRDAASSRCGRGWRAAHERRSSRRSSRRSEPSSSRCASSSPTPRPALESRRARPRAPRPARRRRRRSAPRARSRSSPAS